MEIGIIIEVAITLTLLAKKKQTNKLPIYFFHEICTV